MRIGIISHGEMSDTYHHVISIFIIFDHIVITYVTVVARSRVHVVNVACP